MFIKHICLPQLAIAIAASLLILLPAVHARPLDEAIDGVLQQWNATNWQANTRRYQPCDWEHIASVATEPIQASDDHCTIAAKKGHRLLCMMVSPYTEQSVYQQFRELPNYGYSTQITGNDENPGMSLLTDAMHAIGIETDATRWSFINQGHVINRPGYPRTNAYFQNHVNPREGTVIAHNNKNPDAQNRDLNLRLTEDNLVPLKQWSDVFFLGYRAACLSSRGGVANMQLLSHIFRDNIMNDDTVEVLRSIIGKSNLGRNDMVR